MNKDRFKYRIYNENDKCYVKTPEEGYIPDIIVSPNGDIWDTDYGELFDTYTDGYIIEQCTGLRDKNGVLVYEGDVVRLCEDGKLKHTAYVMWGDGNGTLSGSYIAVSTSERDGRHPLSWIFTPHWEIIGNIHGTKELE